MITFFSDVQKESLKVFAISGEKANARGKDRGSKLSLSAGKMEISRIYRCVNCSTTTIRIAIGKHKGRRTAHITVDAIRSYS